MTALLLCIALAIAGLAIVFSNSLTDGERAGMAFAAVVITILAVFGFGLGERGGER